MTCPRRVENCQLDQEGFVVSSESTISLGKVGILDGLESNELDHFGVLDLEVGCRTCFQ